MSERSRIGRRELLGIGIVLPVGSMAASSIAFAESCGPTPRQTSGPFFPIDDQVEKDIDLTRVAGHEQAADGEVIRVAGRVLDADCRPVKGALVDLWQADTNGRYSHPADPNPAPRDPNFQGWGQAVTDAEGRYAFRTIKPAAYPLDVLADGTPNERLGYRTPHIHFRISKRGYHELTTQMYFAGEPRNETDIVLRRTPRADWPTLVIAAAETGDGAPPVFAFDLTIARV
jgi:protocatechuate 3,4-dioxygenase beta subunit